MIPDIKKEKNTDEAKTNSPIDTVATYTLYTRGRGDLSQNLKVLNTLEYGFNGPKLKKQIC